MAETGLRRTKTNVARNVSVALAVLLLGGVSVGLAGTRQKGWDLAAESENAVVRAVWSRQSEAVETAIAGTPDAVNQCDANGYSPLRVAGHLADVALLSRLLAAGADPNLACASGTALEAVIGPLAAVAMAGMGNREGVTVSGGSSLPQTGIDYGSEADRSARREALDILFESGADPNRRGSGPNPSSPLLTALVSGEEELVSLLLDNGARLEDLGMFEKMMIRMIGRGDLLSAAERRER